MRVLVFLLCLSVAISICSAQPWHWEPYAGNYYNPTGFPNALTYSETVSVGDFNGDGSDEFFCLTGSGFVVATRDNQQFHWTTATGLQDFENPSGTFAMDLDNDQSDELLIFSETIHAWKTATTDPWVWLQRDDLLTGLLCPPRTLKGIYGDYNSNGLLEGVFWLAANGGSNIRRYERNLQGEWIFEDSYNTSGWLVHSLYDGDFDHDGDMDFAVAGEITDIPGFWMYGENSEMGLVSHYPTSISNCGVGGGDLDGDGLWEGLNLKSAGALGYEMVEVELDPDPSVFIHITGSYNLGSAPAPMFAGFRTAQGTKVCAVHSWTFGDPFPVMDAFECITYSDSGWTPVDNGFGNRMDYRFARGSMADLDGDGLNDILAELDAHDFMTERKSWGIWKNIGTPTADTFVFRWQEAGYFSNHFIDNSDTIFTSPQIGNVRGDQRAELAMLAHTGNQPAHIVFFEKTGNVPDTTFGLCPELSNGLTMSFSRIRMADIDNDGLAEVFGYNGFWHSFFYRNGTWVEYDINLPADRSSDISFADINDDGNLDLFTTTQVWYNSSPTSGTGSQALSPATCSLSAFPNPFNPSTRITFLLNHPGLVEIKIFDISGREIARLSRGVFSAGSHSVLWDASHLASEVYFARMTGTNGTQTQKLYLLK